MAHDLFFPHTLDKLRENVRDAESHCFALCGDHSLKIGSLALCYSNIYRVSFSLKTDLQKQFKQELFRHPWI